MGLCGMFLEAKQCLFLLEQPASSIMRLFKRLARRFLRFELHDIWTWMGAFGHGQAKPSRLICNNLNFVVRLQRRLPIEARELMKASQAVDLVWREDGTLAVTGKPAQLKETQEYTKEHAGAVLTHRRRWRNEQRYVDESSDSDYESISPQADWPEAKLGDVAAPCLKFDARGHF